MLRVAWPGRFSHPVAEVIGHRCVYRFRRGSGKTRVAPRVNRDAPARQ
jgi:hypothetical protein